MSQPLANGQHSPALWNPNAAANWSLLFSPAFGAYLQMLNWREMGDQQEASKSQRWFFVSLAVLALYAVAGLVVPDAKSLDGALRLTGLALLLTWYFASGRHQAKHVEQAYGASYVKRGWTSPLLVALAALVAYVLVIFVVFFAVSLIVR